MLSHVHIGISNFDRAFAFYAPILDELGNRLRFRDPEKQWAGWQSPQAVRPLFLIGVPFDGRPAAPGNGQMTALLAPRGEAVLGDARLREESLVARENLSALDAGGDAAARDGLERVGLDEQEAAVFGVPHNRLPDGVLAAAFGGCDEAQELFLADPVPDDHVGHLGLFP